MASVEIEFNLTTFLVNVLKELRKYNGTGDSLEDVKLIKMYPLGDLEIDDLPLPAVLMDLYEVEPDPDANLGTGQLGVQLMMQIWVVVAATDRGAPLTVRKLAMAVGAIIHSGYRFSAPVSPAKVTDIIGMPKLTQQNSNQYLIWSVEWQHATTIGAEDQLCDDPPVDADQINQVLWGTDPDVGPDHEDDYIEPYDVEEDEERYRELVGA